MLLAAASPDAAPAATPSPASSPASSPAAGEAATAAPAPADAPALARDKLPGPAERSLLLDLRRRRLELDARAAAIEQREALLAAAEKRLGVRVAELTSLQTRLEALEAARQDRAAAEWQGLVRVYETMKPRDAAAIFNDLDQPVLLQVVSRMRDSKVAAILAAMAADRASRLTADLSALRARANDAPPTTGDPPARPAAAVPTDLPPPGAAP
jgi:flagellar motility protein MotE (MotC chaperone)